MTNVLQAELIKLTRPRFVTGTIIGIVIAAIVATSIVFLAAGDTPTEDGQRFTTLADLAAAGGGTEAFSVGMSFSGVLVFVVLAANWAAEFGQGTFRTMLMKQPSRTALLAGKLAGLVAYAAVVMLFFEILALVLSLAFAPTQDVSTSEWFTLDGLGEGAQNYFNALLGVSAWASFGMALGVLLRSTPMALGAGLVWAGPFEHLTVEAWDGLTGIYPGLLLEALAVGGTDDVSYARVLVMIGFYAVVATAVAVFSFTRRDVTG